MSRLSANRWMILLLAAWWCGCSPRTNERVAVLVFTDIGRDVDDAQALCYLAAWPGVEIAGVVCTGMIPSERARIASSLLASMGVRAPVAAGSALPPGCADSMLIAAYREAHGYEMEAFYEAFGRQDRSTLHPSAGRLIDSVAARYGPRLRLVVLAQATDLALAMERRRDVFDRCAGVWFQGQAAVEEGILIPMQDAYNTCEDTLAARAMFRLQDRVPFTLVGKHAAYPAAFTRTDMDRLAATGHPAGRYMRCAATAGLEAFARRTPDVFRRVYAVPDTVGVQEALPHLDRCSNPYDALVAVALLHPDYFEAVRAGRHTLIGQDAAHPGICDPSKIKEEIIGTILGAF